MMRIHTVAAGGGSILHYDGARFRVGPDSAGADPGPACYRRGGPLAVTDANVMVGKLLPEFFPAIFGPGQNEPLDAEIVRRTFAELAERIGDGRSPAEVAEGFLSVAVENMANAIKKISVERGYDVTRYVLNCFGGAGGQHACKVADALGMRTVLIHPLSSLLSAYGMGLARIRATREQAVEAPLADAPAVLAETGGRLVAEALAELARPGVPEAERRHILRAHIRYAGSDTALIVEAGAPEAMRTAFEAAHRQRFGFVEPSKPLVIEAVSVEAFSDSGAFVEPEWPPTEAPLPAPLRTTPVFTDGRWHEAPVFRREQLGIGHRITGPALLIEPHQTIMVEPGWSAEITRKNHVLLTRAEPKPRTAAIGTDCDPVMLEIFNNRFMAIAEQMGWRCRTPPIPSTSRRGWIFLRGVRRRGQSGSQCAAHACPSRLDGPFGAGDHRPEPHDPPG